MDLESARVLGEALAIGVLVGVERYRARSPGEKGQAGVRTFAIIGLLGGLCAVAGNVSVAVVTFAAIATLVAIAYYKEPPGEVGATTEIAVFVTFWLGYLVREHETLAIASGILLAILLASKRPLHDFARGVINDVEFYDTLKFLVVVFVIYPLLPDATVDPWGFVNPRLTWRFVVLVSTISYGGYLAVRMLGTGRGLFLSALTGGLVSSTAVTLSLAHRIRQAPQLARLASAAAVVGNSVQFPRLLVLISIVNTTLGERLLAPLLLMCAAGVTGSFVVAGVGRDRNVDPEIEVPLSNPYSFLPALKFALYLTAALVLSQAALQALGERGVYLVAAISGVGSVSAIALPLASFARGGELPLDSAVLALFIAIATNAVTKWLLAAINGGRMMAFWLGGGLATMLATGMMYLWLTA